MSQLQVADSLSKTTNEFEVAIASDEATTNLQPAEATALAESIVSALADSYDTTCEIRVGDQVYNIERADAARLVLLVAEAAASANICNTMRRYFQVNLRLTEEQACKHAQEVRGFDAS